MPDNNSNFSRLDFPVSRKQQPAPKKQNRPKRDVTRADFNLIRKPGLEPIIAAGPAKSEKRDAFTTMPQLLKIGRPTWFSFSMLATVVFLAVFAVQAVNYLLGAKGSTGEILGAATSAYGDLDSAGKSLEAQNFGDAAALFESAKNNISKATSKLDQYKFLTWVVPKARSADHLLNGAYLLAAGGEKLTGSLEIYNNLVVSSKGVESSNFTQSMRESKQGLEESLKLFEEAAGHFNQVKNIPPEYQSSLDEAKSQVATLTKLLRNLVTLEDLYLSFLGGQDKTYLFIFQNHDELRATGGFIGTYGILKVSDGAIKDMKIESIYSLDARIFEQVAAPGPFQPDIKKWGIRDANWFADFPTSARKLLYLFEKGSQSADGVVAITPKIFEDILELTGPISMSQYDTVLTSENFQEVVQQKTSVDYDRELNQPKKFLADFAPILLDRFNNLGEENWFRFLQVTSRNFVEKNIMLYSVNPQTQDQIEQIGFAGKILDSPHDYLMVVNSNLGGTKTDLEIKQNIELNSDLLADGRIRNKLKITRFNSSTEANKNFMRILVPKGSTLEQAQGFDEKTTNSSFAEGYKSDPDLAEWDKGFAGPNNSFVRTEAGKTEITGWIETGPLATTVIELTYVLPFKLAFGPLNTASSFSLLYQKQPGVRSTEFTAVWNLNSYNKVWNSENLNMNGTSLSAKSDSINDEYWSVVLAE